MRKLERIEWKLKGENLNWTFQKEGRLKHCVGKLKKFFKKFMKPSWLACLEYFKYNFPFFVSKICIIIKDDFKCFPIMTSDLHPTHNIPPQTPPTSPPNPLHSKMNLNWNAKKQFNVYLWGYLIINKFFSSPFLSSLPLPNAVKSF